jgi:hypothetical protein
MTLRERTAKLEKKNRSSFGILLTSKVVESEDFSSSFTGASNQLGRVDFSEVIFQEILPEELANGRLNFENALVCLRLFQQEIFWCEFLSSKEEERLFYSQIEDTIVESSFSLGFRVFLSFRAFLLKFLQLLH